MTKIKSLTSLVLSASLLIGGMSIPGCMSEEAREHQRQERVERELLERKAEQERVASTYETIKGFAHYRVPQVDITAKKSSFTLSPSKHIGNALKAQTITLPVSQEYFDSVEVGHELSSKFNTTEFLFGDGNIETYKVKISGKKHGEMYCTILGENQFEETDSRLYEQLLELNGKRKRFSRSDSYPEVFLDQREPQLARSFGTSYTVNIESYKSNFTLDLTKHIANACNHMKYTIEVPGFIGCKLKKGDKLDHNFVGGSLIFSKSPSSITFKINSVHRN